MPGFFSLDDGGASFIMSEMEGDVLAEWRRKSRSILYQSDPHAWMSDILGKRWWSKQEEIAWSVVQNTRTIVKSCNGVGKTQLGGDLVSWFVSVFPPEETSVLLSAPVREQIDTMMFKYLRQNYQLGIQLGNKLLGEITRWPKWVVHDPFDKDIVLPKRPADQNLISSFQGVHDAHVLVGLDEAGGLPEDLYIGAEAVTTNQHARIFAIGNPDRRNTPFHARFTEKRYDETWGPGRHTISAYDSPNFTGEMIYPDDPQRDAEIKKLLVQVQWAKDMEQMAPAGVVAAKVRGEFPDSDDSTFFHESLLAKSWDTIIEEDVTVPKFLGVDLSYQGDDKCAAYLNWGGKIRKVDEWTKFEGTEHIESARRINTLAKLHGVTEVRVDAAGTGSGVYSNLVNLDEFKDRQYTVIGIVGAKSSPDLNQWKTQRTWHYWQFRVAMAAGEIDLDIEDIELRDEIQRQTYKIDKQGRVQITPKDEMKAAGIKSPDHLDAAIYSYVDVTSYTEIPGEAGDVMSYDPWDELGMTRVGLPI